MTKLEKNKYKEALENLIHCKSITKCKECHHKHLCIMERDSDILQELIDKETPMKVNKITNKEKVYFSDVAFVYSYVTLGKCPNCETYLHEENEYGDIINYCPYCGQRLDWSDT